MSAPSDFSLRTYLSTVIANSAATDPWVLAKEAIEGLDPSLRELAFLQAVREALRQAAMEARRSNARVAREPNETEAPAPSHHPHPVPRSRWDDAAGLYARFLAQREAIGGALKRLGDMTRDEVLTIAQVRFEAAKATAAMAQRYFDLAAAMEAHGAETVGDLPQEALMEVFR